MTCTRDCAMYCHVTKMADAGSSSPRDELSESEAEQYDRQIRLWGLDAQKRLRGCRVLVCGLNGLSAEVSKNVVLAGVKSLTLLDSKGFDVEELGARFLISQKETEKKRAPTAVTRLQALNPNVAVEADTGQLEDKEEEYLTQFDVICVTAADTATQVKLNEVCRKHKIKFYAGDTWGYYGYYFVDLGEHHYVEDVTKATQSMNIDENKKGKVAIATESTDLTVNEETKLEKKMMKFCSLQQTRDFDWSIVSAKTFKRNPKTYFVIRVVQAFQDKLKRRPKVSLESEDILELETMKSEVLQKLGLKEDFLDNQFVRLCFSELSPVCAIVGGVLAQEMIKAISAKDEPFNNFFLYDGYCGNGTVELIGQ